MKIIITIGYTLGLVLFSNSLALGRRRRQENEQQTILLRNDYDPFADQLKRVINPYEHLKSQLGLFGVPPSSYRDLSSSSPIQSTTSPWPQPHLSPPPDSTPNQLSSYQSAMSNPIPSLRFERFVPSQLSRSYSYPSPIHSPYTEPSPSSLLRPEPSLSPLAQDTPSMSSLFKPITSILNPESPLAQLTPSLSPLTRRISSTLPLPTQPISSLPARLLHPSTIPSSPLPFVPPVTLGPTLPMVLSEPNTKEQSTPSLIDTENYVADAVDLVEHTAEDLVTKEMGTLSKKEEKELIADEAVAIKATEMAGEKHKTATAFETKEKSAEEVKEDNVLKDAAALETNLTDAAIEVPNDS